MVPMVVVVAAAATGKTHFVVQKVVFECQYPEPIRVSHPSFEPTSEEAVVWEITGQFRLFSLVSQD